MKGGQHPIRVASLAVSGRRTRPSGLGRHYNTSLAYVRKLALVGFVNRGQLCARWCKEGLGTEPEPKDAGGGRGGGGEAGLAALNSTHKPTGVAVVLHGDDEKLHFVPSCF